MGFFGSLFNGFGLVLTSFSYINRNKMAYVYVVVAFIMLLFFIGGMTLLHMGIDHIVDMVKDWVNSPSLPEWVQMMIKVLATIVLWVLSLMVLSIVIGYVIIITLSPLFSKIAETTYTIETGNKVRGGFKRFMFCIWRGIIVALRNAIWQVFLLLVLCVIGFMPLVGLIVPIITIGVNSYFFGLSMFDYSMEARDMRIRASLRYARSSRGTIIGIGMPFTLLLMIPVIGPYLAVIFAPATVVASARFMHRREEQERIFAQQYQQQLIAQQQYQQQLLAQQQYQQQQAQQQAEQQQQQQAQQQQVESSQPQTPQDEQPQNIEPQPPTSPRQEDYGSNYNKNEK